MKIDYDRVYDVPTELVSLDPDQVNPRTHVDEERLQELVQSIKQNGQLQPAIVRGRAPEKGYYLVVGERRWLACQELGIPLKTLVVDGASRGELLMLALRENLDREDLTALEEAIGLSRIQKAEGWSQRELAKKLGRSQAWVGNRMRLLDLTPLLQDYVAQGRISFSAARDHLLPFRSLREDLRVKFYEPIEEVLQAGEVPPEDLSILALSVALDRSRPLSRYRGEPSPLFDAQSWHKGCDCGAPKYDYGHDGGPEVRCFDVAAWDEAQAKAGRAPATSDTTRHHETSPPPADSAKPASSSKTRKVVLDEPEQQERKAGVLLIDSSGQFTTAMPTLLEEDVPEKDLVVEQTEAGPLVWWVASSSTRELARRNALDAVRDRALELAKKDAARDLEKAADMKLDVRALQEILRLPLELEIDDEVDRVGDVPPGFSVPHRVSWGTGKRLLVALLEIAWGLGYETPEEGGELLPWWRARPPGEVAAIARVLLVRVHGGSSWMLGHLRDLCYAWARDEVQEAFRTCLWDLVGEHYG